jgi:thiamine biosynthesis lipoprotein
MRRVELVWGSAISVDVRDSADASLLDTVFDWFEEVDRLFSTWRNDSEIVRYASGEIGRGELDARVVSVLNLAEAVRIETNGAFDVTATARMPEPHEAGWCSIDPSGLVKGWAVEQAASMLEGQGASAFWINAGGDVLTRGSPSPDAEWRVGIQHPWQLEAVATVLQLRDGAVATSGRYERGDHVIDPRTGEPARGLASVTVVGNDLARADAYATAAMALGPDGLDWLAGRSDLDAMAITDDQLVWTTPGFAQWQAESRC